MTNIEDRIYITVIAFNNLHGNKPLQLNSIVKLVKEPENRHDTEAIACEMRHFGKIGYVANSTNTVVKGCMSSGRLYDKIDKEYFAKIKFITGNTAISEILTSDEYIKEIENPESDIHYLAEYTAEADLHPIENHTTEEDNYDDTWKEY